MTTCDKDSIKSSDYTQTHKNLAQNLQKKGRKELTTKVLKGFSQRNTKI
jgi:hypothetical protein